MRRAGSSSRRSGAWRRAATGLAGASASSGSSSSAGSMALPALSYGLPPDQFPATSSLFSPRSFVRACDVAFAIDDCSARLVHVKAERRPSRTEASKERFPSSCARGGRRAPRGKRGVSAAHGAGGENCSAASRPPAPPPLCAVCTLRTARCILQLFIILSDNFITYK